ncbi:hypothetical protein WJX77_006060 [Trebouxia sp. C0004]
MVRRHSSSLLRLDIHQEPTCAAVPTGAQSDFGLMTCFTAQCWGGEDEASLSVNPLKGVSSLWNDQLPSKKLDTSFGETL